MKLIDKMEEYQINHSSIFSLCKNYHELEFALNEGKFCGIMGAEGGKMIEGSIDNLQILYNRGVRYLGLTWNTSNEIAVSAKDEYEKSIKSGLTEFGKNVVKKMNEIGMIIDVSHLSESAFWDVVSLSTSPIIASHSNCYTLAPHYRNLTDDQIKAIANSGGYIGINFYYKFIVPNANQNEITNIQSKFKNYSNKLDDSDLIAFNEQRYEFMLNNSSNAGVSIDKLIDHIDYIVKLAGIDYVGLGSDFDGSITTVNELYDATCYPVLTKKLSERGYKDDEIKKILGGNFIRVFKQVCSKR
jgi:membrane dipeptidase